jgi:hypothetical protein
VRTRNDAVWSLLATVRRNPTFCRTIMKRKQTFAFVMALTPAIAACGQRATPRVAALPVPARAFLGQPCALRSPARASEASVSPRVFVEVAQVERPPDERAEESSEPPMPEAGKWLDDPRSTIVWSFHLIAANDAPASIGWDVVSVWVPSQVPPDNPRWRLSVTPHLQSTVPKRIRIDLLLEQATNIASAPESIRVNETVVIGDQQTVFLAVPKRQTSALVVTPYIVGNDDELRKLFFCKTQRGLPQATSAGALPRSR